MRLRLGAKIALIIMLVAILAGGSVGVAVILNAWSALRIDALQSSLTAADLGAALSEDYVLGVRSAAQDLAERSSFRQAATTGDFASLTPELVQWQARNPHSNSVGVFDLAGINRATGQADQTVVGRLSVVDLPWFQAAVATGAPQQGYAQVARINGQPTAPYHVPILDDAGRVGAVLAVGVSLRALSDTLLHADLGVKRAVSLIDLDRAVYVADADPTRLLQPIAAAPDVTERLLGRERGTAETTGENGAMLVAFAPVAGMEWGIVVEQPATAAFAPISSMVQLSVLWIVIAVAVAGLIGMQASRPITRAARQVARAAKGLARGDLNQQVTIDSHDELGQMADAVREMIASQRGLACVATAIAGGDLTPDVEPKGSADVLGAAFQRMVANLRASVGELEDSKQHFQAIIENASDVIFIVADNHVIRYASPAVERTLGYPPSQLTGTRIAEYIHPEDVPALRIDITELLRGKPSHAATTRRWRHIDGSWRVLETIANNLLDTPAVAGLVVYARDVTERVGAEQERLHLLEQIDRERATLAAVTGSLSDGLALFSVDGAELYKNGPAIRQFGMPAGANAAATFARLRTDLDNPEEILAEWQRALTHLEEQPRFDVIVDGATRRDLQLQLFPVADEAGATLGMGLLARDMTAERDLSRAKDELVAVVGHELLTPLASLVGFAELLLARDTSEAQRLQYHTIIVQQGRRLSVLINDFLDLQRMEQGPQRLTLLAMALRPIIEQAVVAAGEDVRHSLRWAVADDLPLVLADADHLQQVLCHLLSNARKYSPSGGDVHVAANLVRGEVQVSIRDDGIGISPDVLPRLFERFYRADNSTTRSINGAGLGLTISRKIVEGHGGRLWGESPGLGQGASFMFTLPVADRAGPAGEDLRFLGDGSGASRPTPATPPAAGLREETSRLGTHVATQQLRP